MLPTQIKNYINAQTFNKTQLVERYVAIRFPPARNFKNLNFSKKKFKTTVADLGLLEMETPSLEVGVRFNDWLFKSLCLFKRNQLPDSVFPLLTFHYFFFANY